ncbi:hypothetical protein [uncultured Flavobacterium sp.]|jgi:hypothetical protein|uniref:hypothetical protein n=1 Tax=uncultured Flavobacterium sp. TaxID=165435 RepID=UPI00260B02E1|nr:hypothetical protein [uncultured Flavobacterium sp.]
MNKKINIIKFKTLIFSSDLFEIKDNVIDISLGNLILVNGYFTETESPIFWAWFKVINHEKIILGISNSEQSIENESVLNKIGDCIIKSGTNIKDAEEKILNIYN